MEFTKFKKEYSEISGRNIYMSLENQNIPDNTQKVESQEPPTELLDSLNNVSDITGDINKEKEEVEKTLSVLKALSSDISTIEAKYFKGSDLTEDAKKSLDYSSEERAKGLIGFQSELISGIKKIESGLNSPSPDYEDLVSQANILLSITNEYDDFIDTYSKKTEEPKKAEAPVSTDTKTEITNPTEELKEKDARLEGIDKVKKLTNIVVSQIEELLPSDISLTERDKKNIYNKIFKSVLGENRSLDEKSFQKGFDELYLNENRKTLIETPAAEKIHSEIVNLFIGLPTESFTDSQKQKYDNIKSYLSSFNASHSSDAKMAKDMFFDAIKLKSTDRFDLDTNKKLEEFDQKSSEIYYDDNNDQINKSAELYDKVKTNLSAATNDRERLSIVEDGVKKVDEILSDKSNNVEEKNNKKETREKKSPESYIPDNISKDDLLFVFDELLANDSDGKYTEKLEKYRNKVEKKGVKARYIRQAKKYYALIDVNMDTGFESSGESEPEETNTKAEEEVKAKAEVEVKAKAEVEAKEKAEEEAKAKAEAEEKAKAETEVKAKAEVEAKTKAELEAKTKAEAEVKEKAEAEAKEKAEVEEKAKAEVEVKAKAEAEEKAKAETEAKEKAEVEAKEKAEAEAKAKAEAEAKAKAEAEAKTKAEAEATAKEQSENNERITKPIKSTNVSIIEIKVKGTPKGSMYDAGNTTYKVDELLSFSFKTESTPDGYKPSDLEIKEGSISDIPDSIAQEILGEKWDSKFENSDKAEVLNMAKYIYLYRAAIDGVKKLELKSKDPNLGVLPGIDPSFIEFSNNKIDYYDSAIKAKMKSDSESKSDVEEQNLDKQESKLEPENLDQVKTKYNDKVRDIKIKTGLQYPGFWKFEERDDSTFVSKLNYIIDNGEPNEKDKADKYKNQLIELMGKNLNIAGEDSEKNDLEDKVKTMEDYLKSFQEINKEIDEIHKTIEKRLTKDAEEVWMEDEEVKNSKKPQGANVDLSL